MSSRLPAIVMSQPPTGGEFSELNRKLDIIVEASSTLSEASYLGRWFMWIRNQDELLTSETQDWVWLFPAAPNQWATYLWISNDGITRHRKKTLKMLFPFRHVGIVSQGKVVSKLINCVPNHAQLVEVQIKEGHYAGVDRRWW